jgi:hypothetical protein
MTAAVFARNGVRFVVALCLLGCGGESKEEPAPLVDFDHGTVFLPPDAGPAPRVGPPFEHSSYPSGPYGHRPGAVFPAFDFLGWRTPKVVNYDPAKLEPVSLSDFYHPNGPQRLLVVINVAMWCAPCNVMFETIDEEGLIASWSGMGVELLAAVSENSKNPPAPAEPTDLQNWGMKYGVEFALVLDSTFKLGPFTDEDSVPVLVFVDPRTMKISRIQTGADVAELKANVTELAK